MPFDTYSARTPERLEVMELNESIRA